MDDKLDKRFDNDAEKAEGIEDRVDETYNPESMMKFPEGLREALPEYAFRWVLNDPARIRKYRHPNEGYSFVTPDEIPEEVFIELGEASEDGEKIVYRDVVLMKVTKAKNEARRRYYANKVRSQELADKEKLARNQINDSSKTRTVHGRDNAQFFQN